MFTTKQLSKGEHFMRKAIVLLSFVLVSSVAMAGSKAFNLSLTPDVAIQERSDSIEGLTLSIWGENQQTSLAIGFVNGSTGNSAGLSWGFLLNYADNYKGVQWAPINYTSGDFLGWQGGFLNYVENNMKGLQTGLLNYAGKFTGLQFGFMNFAEDADAGVQIGLINIIRSNQDWFKSFPDELAPGMIFVNWRF
jgi:hypothetical protein